MKLAWSAVGPTMPHHQGAQCHVIRGPHAATSVLGPTFATSAMGPTEPRQHLGPHCHVSGGVHIATSALGPTMPRQHWPHISYATLHGFFNLNNATLNLNMQQ